ncbi:uncharacterized protein N7459_008184 [Penicillium hispanicum]|uniref:uncharacterized protein n=1 Tax=Penicillium hispanicum TaxID=1080232 RepID=UPI002541349D|nr:uncharacterized protein N7459_008184 [Penicillium hispanicum]KAJ5573757.1 hypothetical protein N7459_008184 [Penicillium hispanicum]
MLGKDQKQPDAQARQDEARLLGARDYKDKDAVSITPGATIQKHKKTPGSFAAFKPTDRLSNSRGSGPIRAQGKPKEAAFQPNRNLPGLDDPIEFKDSTRPNKRRRHEDVRKGSSLTNDGVSDPFTPAYQAPRVSPGSSSFSTKSKNNGLSSHHDEYRGVEDSVRINPSPRRLPRRQFSDESQEERFTLRAAMQRRSGINVENQSSHKTVKSDQPGQAYLESVEIPVTKDRASAHTRPSKPLLSNATRCESDGRESPDELQGEATTQPLPKHPDEKSNQIRGNINKEHLVSPSRKRSPADIEPTDFLALPRQGLKKTKRSHKSSMSRSFQVLSLGFGPVRKNNVKGKSAAIQLGQENITLGEDIAGPEKNFEIPLRNVIAVERGEPPSLKVILKLSHYVDAPGSRIDIEFLLQDEKKDFVRVFQSMQVKIVDKSMSYMDKAFSHHEHELSQYGNRPKRTFVDSSLVEPTPRPVANSSVRQKLSSSLQDSTGETSGNKRAKVNGTGEPSSMDGPGGHKQDSDSAVEIPVKPFRKAKSPGRETRTTRRTTRLSSSRQDISPGLSRKTSPEDDDARSIWQKPLVYPPAGKKRAEVSVEDRDRLRADEFLNDNLIGFYMRFLQDHLERTNKEAAKKVYFFNSYFFATLSNTRRSGRGINYEGVEKWTRNVDLFTYDYVVVPINQNAHWYVAIICNLPSLPIGSAVPAEQFSAPVSDKELSNQPESEVQEILESPEPEQAPAPVHDASPDADLETKQKQASESPTSQETRQGIASMTIEEGRKTQGEVDKEKKKEPTSADEWPDTEETPAALKLSPFRSPKSAGAEERLSTVAQPVGTTKKKGRSGPKLDPFQPTIITFDSLDLARSPTIKSLREYVCEEAASKRGVKINSGDIKGMRARQIPLQPNYSDCGLYLLAYVEKFIQNPDSFIKKSLRREMDAHTDWPALGSGLLRRRFRDFLDELYDEQAQTTEKQILMADKLPVSFLLGPSSSSSDVNDQTHAKPPRHTDSSRAEEEHQEHVPDDRTALDSPDADELKEGSTPDEPRLMPTGSVAAPSSTDETSEQFAPTTKQPSPLDDEEVIQVPDSQETLPSKSLPSESDIRPNRDGQRDIGKYEGASSRTRSGKKAAKAADTDIVEVRDSGPARPAGSAKEPRVEPLVEIQVQATPPHSQPEGLRKSPRSVRRNH